MQTSASAFERHQNILQLLKQLKSVRVADLATRLDVSETTIRSDLELLDTQGYLTRVRGGAVLREPTPPPPYPGNKATQHGIEKKWIARWAASLIEDGDVIMLDASSTVFHIAHFLSDRRELVVFTNGISIAQILAAEPSNTVIVLGGILRSNGNAITGSISGQVLRDYHIQRAFVSCSGFSPDIGFFEADIQEARMKQLMLEATQQRIVLLDASKVGQKGLTTFADLTDVDLIATDDRVSPDVIAQVQATQTQVVVCSEQTTRSYAPRHVEASCKRIAFANLSEQTSFSRDVRRGLESAVQQRGGIELVLADNHLDSGVALRVADELLNQNLDLLIEYQIDEQTGNLIAHKFQKVDVPVISVDIPMVGATYFGVNNYEAGKIAGVALGHAIKADWDGAFELLIVVEQRRAGKLPAMRIQGQLDGLHQVLDDMPDDRLIRINFDNTTENAYQMILAALETVPQGARLAMICFNDDAAVGALQAARDTGHISHVRLVGQGADRRLRNEMRRDQRAIVGATAFCPEDYGEHLIDLALAILAGKQTPPAVYTKHFFVNPDNVDQYYPADTEE